MNILKLFSISILYVGITFGFMEQTKMVVDVIKSYEKPTAVLANVCWKLSEKSKLMEQLMKAERPVTISFVTDQKQIERFHPKDTLIITDMNCHSSGQFLQDVDDNHVFSKPYRWLIIQRHNEFRSVPTELSNLHILLDSEVILAKQENNTFKLNLIYRIDSTSQFRTEDFGIWTAEGGFVIAEEVTKYTMVIRRKDLRGKSIAASYVITDNRTRTNLHDIKDNKLDNYAKATYHNILPLYYFMNATPAFLFTNSWGYYLNNSWNGMMGQLIHGDAELCGTISFISLERVGLVNYITQPIPIRTKFVFREPPLSFQNNLFILPFRGSVWMSIGGLIIILILIMYINAKWEISKDEEKTMQDHTILKPYVSDIGMVVISAITQQGSTSELKGSLGRVVIFLLFLIFLFLYTSYSANIVALLQSSSKQIRTLNDLLNSKLELGVEDVVYNRHYFPAATDPVRKAIYETKLAKVGYKPNFMSMEEGIRRLRNKDTPFAFHMNQGIGYKIVEELFHDHEKCGLHEIIYYPNSIPWTCSKKGSPYREIYKVGLARTFEHGMGERVLRFFYVQKPVCNMRGGSFASVNMVDFHPVLIWLLYGMGLSVCLLVGEILMYRSQKPVEKE